MPMVTYVAAGYMVAAGRCFIHDFKKDVSKINGRVQEQKPDLHSWRCMKWLVLEGLQLPDTKSQAQLFMNVFGLGVDTSLQCFIAAEEMGVSQEYVPAELKHLVESNPGKKKWALFGKKTQARD